VKSVTRILKSAAVVALVIATSSLLLGSFMPVLTTAQEQQLDRRSINQNTSTTSAGIIGGNKTIVSKPTITRSLNDTDSESTRLVGPSDTILPNYPCDIDNVWFLDEEIRNFFGEDEPISDCVYGSSLTDYIDGDSGNDYLYGREGNDVIYGASGNDRIEGNGGADFLRGGSDNDTINGGTESDHIQDEGGQDIVFGADGDDEFINGPEGDDLNCGAGIDVIWSLPADAEDAVNDDCEIRTPYSKDNCPPGTDPTLPGGFGACMPF
jgi:Ca2+-binding RTX toxin-like protein